MFTGRGIWSKAKPCKKVDVNGQGRVVLNKTRTDLDELLRINSFLLRW